MKLIKILLIVFITSLTIPSCKIEQPAGKRKLFRKATVKRTTTGDTITVIKQKR